MIAAADPNVLTAIIGVPAAMVVAIGTVWGMNKVRGRGNGNGHDSVSGVEFRRALENLKIEMRGEVNSLRTDINARFDLLVRLINTNGRR